MCFQIGLFSEIQRIPAGMQMAERHKGCFEILPTVFTVVNRHFFHCLRLLRVLLNSAGSWFKVAVAILTLMPHGNAFSQESVELEEIVVEDTGEPEAKLPLGIGISGETLRTMPGAGGDPAKSLQNLPGVNFADDLEGLPAVRGSRPGDNYFQSDFAPVSYLFHVNGWFSVFHPDLIKSFNVYQSAYGPEFAGVTGGVFDVELRDPKNDRIRSTFDVSLYQAGALVEGPLTENQSFYLAGRISYLDLFVADQLEDDSEVNTVQFPKYKDYQGKYVWQADSDSKLTVQFNGASDESREEVTLPEEEAPNNPGFVEINANKSSFDEQALVWDSAISDRTSIKSMLSHNALLVSGTFGSTGESYVRSDEVLLKSHAKIDINDSHDLEFGGQVLRANADANLSLNNDPCSELEFNCTPLNIDAPSTSGTQNLVSSDSRKTSSVKNIKYTAYRAFIKDNWTINDRFTLYPGIALHGEDQLDKQFVEPRLSMEFSLNQSTLLTAGLGQYQQAPGFLESDAVFGNPNLDYSHALHGQIGVQKDFVNGWDIKSEIYYKSFENLVVSNSTDNYSNDGSGHAFGFDTLIRKNLTDKISGWAAIALAEVRRKDDRTGETFLFDYDQPFNVSVVGSYQLNHKWNFGTRLWVHSGAPYTPLLSATTDAENPDAFITQYGKPNSARTPTYKRLDLRIERTFKRKKDNSTIAYFELHNALGTENVADYLYNNDFTEREPIYQLEGFFAFGVKATF